MRTRDRVRLDFQLQLGKHLNRPNEGAWIDPDVESFARRLMHRAKTLHRIAEMECSVEMSETEAKRIERQSDRKQELIEEDCKTWGTVWRVSKQDGPEYPVRVQFVDWDNKDAPTPNDAGCYAWMHEHHSSSVSHAIEHEGYKIEEVPVIEPVFQGDPRGAVVKLRLATGYTDDWGNTGLCVPTPGD